MSSPTRARGGAGGHRRGARHAGDRSPPRRAAGRGRHGGARSGGAGGAGGDVRPAAGNRDQVMVELLAGGGGSSAADDDAAKLARDRKARKKKAKKTRKSRRRGNIGVGGAGGVGLLAGRRAGAGARESSSEDSDDSEEELPAVDYMARWDRAVMALSSSRPIKQKLLDLSAYASNHADFADVPLRVKEVELVAAGLPELHMLTIFGAHLMSLNLTNCSLSANGARALAYGLVENRTLKKLWLNGNPIGPEGVQHIAQALRHNEHLMSLNLASTSLERGPWLRNDEYDHMVFDSDYRGVEALADMLCANRTLTRLNVAKNHLRARGVELLVPALRAHVSLKSVSLAMNNINPSAFLYIGRIMLDNTVLFKLDVRGHNLQMRGCKLLCEGLRRNFSVQTLNVRNCGLTGEHMKVHLGPLLGNGTVRSFDASYNNLGSEGMTVMADVVEKSSMTSLDLSSVSATDNGVELAGALEFMERLATNRNLVDLALAHNNLVLFNFRAKDSRDDDYGAIDALSAALRTNRTLIKVDVSENGIKVRGQRVLRDALAAQPRGIRWALDIKEVLDAWIDKWTKVRAASGMGYPRTSLKWARIRVIQTVFQCLEETRQVMY